MMLLIHSSEHYVFTTLNLLILVLYPVYSWKLQLCLNGSIYETTSDNCKSGIWFTEPMVVHKICFEHGVWAIYKEFCEDVPVIWTVLPSTKGCIRHEELGNRILGVVSIGPDEHSGAIASTSNRRLFFNNHRLKHGMKVSFVNTPAYLEVLTWGHQEKFALFQYNSDRGTLQQCLIKGDNSFFGYYRVGLESYQNTSFFLAKNACLTPLASNSGESKRVHLLPSEIDFDILQSNAENMDDDDDGNMKCERYAKIDDQFEKDLDGITGILAKEPDGNLLSRSSLHIVENLVDQETHKIAMKLLGVHFRNDAFIGNEFKAWQFFNVAKQIFSLACPESMFPNHVDTDKRTTQRIQNTLQVCLRNATTLEFKTGTNCTQDAPLFIKSFPNGTQFDILVEMPAFIKIDGVNYDLLMESIWKLMNFAHYYCADNFQDFAADYSVLEDHWYKLFSPSVIRRWKYPGRGYLAFQKIFSSIDLEKSVRNLDLCVSAARLHSSYKGWLKRPLAHWVKDKHISGSSGSTNDSLQLMWNGQAHCIRDYMDPALKFPYANSIEKCGIRSPFIPLSSRNVF